MKILLSWLQEFCPIEKSPDEIADFLTRAGIEVDQIETITPDFSGIIAARIESASPLASGHTLCTVYDGKNQFQVVAGAKNIYAGMITAYAPIGASCPVAKKVTEKEIQNVVSHGFLCSERDLGLSEYHEGVIVLDKTLLPGKDLSTYFADVIFDVSLTPNLGHCMSVLGVARELSAFSNVALNEMPWQRKEGSVNEKLTVTVDETGSCSRYSGWLIDAVTVNESPTLMRLRLERSGIRPINSVVDITNYVAHEMGQPMHAFDAEQVKDQKIIVRKSRDGEKLLLLDGVERSLQKDLLIIADVNEPLAVAGVMGGELSSVTNKTTSIIFESAYFCPKAVRRASKTLSLMTDSSKRFERGCDQNITTLALGRAFDLLETICPGIQLTACKDVGEEKKLSEVAIRLSRAGKLLGYEVSVDEVETAFSKLGFTYRFDGKDLFTVTVPSYRHDITEEVDLIEEVGKLVGLQSSKEIPLYYTPSSAEHDPMYLFTGEVRARLVAESLQEVITCDLISPKMVSLLVGHPVKKESIIELMNPLSVEQSVMRPSLLPGLLDSYRRNVLQRAFDFQAFEIGHVHLKKDSSYLEPLCFGILLAGSQYEEHFKQESRIVDFFDLKGIIENLLSSLGFSSVTVEKSSLSILHPGRQANIFVSGHHVGMIGELHPDILKNLDLPEGALFAECDMHELLKLQRQKQKFKALPLFPASDRDWTITVEKTVTFDTLMEKINKERPSLLESVRLVSLFEHEKLGANRHNVTLHFVYRDREKTVQQEEVDKAHKALVEMVQKSL